MFFGAEGLWPIFYPSKQYLTNLIMGYQSSNDNTKCQFILLIVSIKVRTRWKSLHASLFSVKDILFLFLLLVILAEMEMGATETQLQ